MAIFEGSLPDQPLQAARLVMSCTGNFNPDSPIQARNSEVAEAWLIWLRDSAGRAEGTVKNYAGVVARFLDLCVGDRPLSAVTVEEIEEWSLRPRGGRARGGRGKPATRARNLTIIRTMYRWLHARGHVPHDVGQLVVTPTVHNREPKAISDAVWKAVWPLACRSDVPAVIPLILGLGHFFGLRRHEIANLAGAHVDVAGGRLVGFVRKGGGDDTFPAIEVLEVWDAKRPDLLAPWSGKRLWQLITETAANGPDGPLTGLRGSGPYGSADLVNKRLNRFLMNLGYGEAFTPHALRHTFVTNLLRMGMPIEMVSELANHSDISVTMRYRKGGGGLVSEWLRGGSQETA